MLFYSYRWCTPSALSIVEITRLTRALIVGDYHLWFVPALLGAGLLLYSLRNIGGNILLFLSMILFGIGVLMQYAGNYHLVSINIVDKYLNVEYFYRNALFLGFPFFSVGYLINLYGLNERFSERVLFIACVFCLAFLLAEVSANYLLLDGCEGFDIYASLFLICPAVFMLIIKLNLYGKGKNIMLMSSSIYFAHPFVIFVLSKFVVLHHSALFLCASIFSILMSFLLIKLNKIVKIAL